VSPLRGEKPQNWPLSKLNTGRFALRAMLPVMKTVVAKQNKQFNMYNLKLYCRYPGGGGGFGGRHYTKCG